MMYLRQSIPKVLLAVAIASTLVACGDSKVSQCNALATALNKSGPIGEKFQQEGKAFETAAKKAKETNNSKALKEAISKSANSFNSLTQQLEALIKEIEAVDLKDEQLIALKDQYVKNALATNTGYQEMGKALVTISKSDNSLKGLQELKQSANVLAQNATKMNGLAKEANKIATDFNGYCGAMK